MAHKKTMGKNAGKVLDESRSTKVEITRPVEIARRKTIHGGFAEKHIDPKAEKLGLGRITQAVSGMSFSQAREAVEDTVERLRPTSFPPFP